MKRFITLSLLLAFISFSYGYSLRAIVIAPGGAVSGGSYRGAVAIGDTPSGLLIGPNYRLILGGYYSISEIYTDITEPQNPSESKPLVLKFEPIRPNIIRDVTTLSFSLPRETKVSLMVFDVTGRVVKRILDNETLGEGYHTIRWDLTSENGEKLNQGIYFVNFVADGHREVHKIMVVR